VNNSLLLSTVGAQVAKPGYEKINISLGFYGELVNTRLMVVSDKD
jgi:hypothetical protein